MKRKRILKILKFRGDEGLNLTRLSNGYETYAANARQIAGLFIMACLQTPMKRAQVVTASRVFAQASVSARDVRRSKDT